MKSSRRSILSVVRDEQPQAEHATPQTPAEPAAARAGRAPAEPTPSKAKEAPRMAKKHIGGYYPVNDPTIKAFQKLGIDLDKDQQDMLHEAMADYIAKHQAANAFR